MASLSARLLLCFLFLSAPICVRAQTAATTDAELQKGQELYRAGDIAGALSTLRRIALSRPNDPNVLFSLAEALGDQGSLQEAEAAYLKAIPLYQQLQARGTGSGATYRPNIAMSLNNLAIIYSREKRFDEADAAIQRALASWTTPTSRPATFFVTRGIVFEGQHKTAQASEAYRAALARSPQNPDALLNLGILLTNQGVSDEAIKLLRKGVSVSPNDPEMFAALGNSLLKAGLWDDAVLAFRQSDALQPDASNVLFNLSSALQHQGHTSEALVVIQKAHALAPGDPAISSNLGALLVQTGHSQEGALLLQSILESHQGDPEISLALAKALESQGKVADAIVLTQKVLQVRSDYPEAVALLTSLLIETGKTAEAMNTVQPALAAHPASAELLNAYGLVLLAQEKSSDAATQFQRSLALDPAIEDAKVNHAIALNQGGKSSDAVAEFQSVLQANSRNLKAQAGLAKAFFDLHQYAESASAFGRAVELAPDDPTLHTNMDIALEKLGRTEEAKRAFAEAQGLRSSKSPKP